MGMEASQEQFEMPRELHRPGPRSIRRRSGVMSGCGLIFGRLFILPHMIVGIGMLIMAPLTIVKVYFGESTQGVIVKKWITTGEDTNYHVKYQYDADGVHHGGERTCSKSAYDAIGDPQESEAPVEIRRINVFGVNMDEAILPGESRLGRISFYLLFGFVWNAILSVFVYVLWIHPWRTRQLYRWGKPVPGRICSKRISSGEDMSYYLGFEFIQPKFGMLRTELSVTSDRFMQAREGQLVTVLCYLHKRWPAVVYEYGDYHCV